MMKLRLKAEVENVDLLTEFVNEQLEGMDCPLKAMMQIDIALDELFGNVCNYAYGEQIGDVVVEVEELEEQNMVRISLIDAGVPFDPLAKDDPDISLSLHERTVGGLGIFMVKRTMDELRYEYREGNNIVTITKSI